MYMYFVLGALGNPKLIILVSLNMPTCFFSNVYIELLIAISMYVVGALGSPFLKLVAKVKSTYSKILEYVALKNV